MTRFTRLTLLFALALPLAAAAQQGAQITPNYKDADLGQGRTVCTGQDLGAAGESSGGHAVLERERRIGKGC